MAESMDISDFDKTSGWMEGRMDGWMDRWMDENFRAG